jgi:hypothetical protein
MLFSRGFLALAALAILQQPARDTPAQPAIPIATPARISGRVLAADTGRPVRRARVLLASAAGPQRNVLTDDNGTFELMGLAGGRYTLTASRSGFVTLSYGQRRPRQGGTPLELAAGQDLKGIDIRLPRGSVITGRIVDDSGEAMAGVMVRVLAYQYGQGERRLTAAGGGQTDDRGEYRIWGLNPGTYYVTAIVPNLNLGGRGEPPTQGRAAAPDAGSPGSPSTAYAPTYYPGVTSVGEARPVAVALGAEATEISFAVLLTRTAQIAGRVVHSDGTPASNGNVVLMPGGQMAAGRGGPFNLYGSRLRADGQFSIANVPPGLYSLRARSDIARVPQFGEQQVSVSGSISDLLVTLTPPGSLAGTVVFETTSSAAAPDPSQLRVSAPAADSEALAPGNDTRVNREGAFTLNGVPPGLHFVRAAQTPRGWMLKSVLVDGRETADTPLEIRSGQSITNVQLIFTDRLTDISGTITDRRGTPMTALTVLAFPRDDRLWGPHARQIATTRPDQNGKFQMRGLPPGEYHLALIDPVEQGEWFDPGFLRQQLASATPVSLFEGELKTQDFRLSTEP